MNIFTKSAFSKISDKMKLSAILAGIDLNNRNCLERPDIETETEFELRDTFFMPIRYVLA